MGDNLDRLEAEVLTMLMDGDDPVIHTLRCQSKLAARRPREISGVGFFTSFEIPPDAPRIEGAPSFSFGDVHAEIEGLTNGAGFVLFVENGALRATGRLLVR